MAMMSSRIEALAKRQDSLVKKLEEMRIGLKACYAEGVNQEAGSSHGYYEACFVNNRPGYQGNNPYGNNYNQGMRPHPNLSWKDGIYQ